MSSKEIDEMVIETLKGVDTMKFSDYQWSLVTKLVKEALLALDSKHKIELRKMYDIKDSQCKQKDKHLAEIQQRYVDKLTKQDEKHKKEIEDLVSHIENTNIKTQQLKQKDGEGGCCKDKEECDCC